MTTRSIKIRIKQILAKLDDEDACHDMSSGEWEALVREVVEMLSDLNWRMEGLEK